MEIFGIRKLPIKLWKKKKNFFCNLIILFGIFGNVVILEFLLIYRDSKSPNHQ